MAESESPSRSIQNLGKILSELAPTDSAELRSLDERLIGLIDSDLLSKAVAKRLQVAHGALARVIRGDATDPYSVLGGVADALNNTSRLALDEEAVRSQDAIAKTSALVLPEDTDLGILNEFAVESNEHLEMAEGVLLDFESTRDDPDSINKIFRAFHTIKGTAGFLGLSHLQDMSHYAESILSDAREGNLDLVGVYVDLILECCDLIKSMVADLENAAPGSELVLPDSYGDLLSRLKNPSTATPTLSPKKLAEETDGEFECPRVGDILVAEGKVTLDCIEKVEESKPDGVMLGKALVDSGAIKQKDLNRALQKQKQIVRNNTPEVSVRVGTKRLDSLIDIVGELVIAQSMVSQDPHVYSGDYPLLNKNVSHASKLVRELQDLTLGLRMVPLKATFQKMIRLVRDLGRKGRKDVQFVGVGEETEIDRNMVEALNDPLVHMIRNSIDHGLESAEERVRNGKQATGTITLRAFQSAGSVVIELADDGRGLDKRKILAKAVSQGLIQPEVAVADSDAFSLIFNPGFSTADRLSDISGRGVGMDVVKKSIESLRGRIETTSKLGQGTTFTIYLPLTMAITDAMILLVGSERYLLPTIAIEQSFRPSEKQLFTVTETGEMVMLRGDLIPVVRLNRLFGIAGGVSKPSEGLLVCVEAEGKRCALLVDEILGQQQVVVKSLGEWIGEIPGVSGGTILGDGRIGLILDVAGLIRISNAGVTKSASLPGDGDEADLWIGSDQIERTQAG